MFESQRVGERPYGSSSQAALLLAQIDFWRRVTSTKKVAKCIESRSGKTSKKHQHKNSRGKHMYVKLGWATLEVEDIREKGGIKTLLQKSDKHKKRKSTGILARYRDIFILFYIWIRQERFLIFSNTRPNFVTNLLRNLTQRCFHSG